MRKFEFCLSLGLLIIVCACAARADDKPAKAAEAPPIAIVKLDRTTPVDFEKEILPLLSTSCLACHSRTKPKSGLVLETPTAILKGGEGGPAVVAGKPSESRLIKSAAHSDADLDPMPPPGNKVNAANLTGQQLGLLSLWIEQGAKGEVKAAAPLAWRAVAESVQPIYAIAMTADGSLIAAGRGTGIDLYDINAKKRIAHLTDPALEKSAGGLAAHRDLVQSLAFSPDGKTLASGAYREVKLWVRGGDSEAGDWKLDKTIGGGGNDSPLLDRVNAIDFSRDGELMAFGGGVPSRSGQIVIYAIKSGKIEKSWDEIHSDSVTALQFTADGKRLVSGSTDKFIRLIDLSNGKILRTYEAHSNHVLGVTINSSGKTIASAGADNSLKLWNAETGERDKKAPPFDKEVTAVHYIGDSDVLLACSGDGKFRSVRPDGTEATQFAAGQDFLYCLAASADGKVVASAGQEGVVRIWSADGKILTKFGRSQAATK